jgi:hypothetical protein
MDIFKKNIDALKNIDIELANKIENIKTNSTFEVFVNDSYENANIVDNRDNQAIYLNTPIKEIEETITKLEKSKYYKVLYFYGIGNGHLYKRLLQNRHHRTIYIIEPELELLYIALNLTDLSQEILSSRALLIHAEDALSSNLSLKIKSIDQVYFKAYELAIHSDYYEKYIEDIERVNKEITKVFSYFINSTGNDATDELLGLKNFIHNLPTMIKNPSLTNLVENGKNTETAVIVATGPSLAKQLPLLKKIQNYVTIISVDASLPILEKEGIKPDIVTSIERIELTAKFYEQTSKEFQEDIIFALTAIVDQKLLDNIKAGQLQLNMRPTGSHYFYMQLDDWGYIGQGMSAANLAYELATKIEYKNIILIGQDLAYGKDGSSHSKNHIFGEDEVKHNKTKDDYITAYGGEGKVKTTWAWKLFLSGYERVIAQNNINGKITTINATEGGARIHGTKELTFEKTISTYVDKSKNKSKIKLQNPTQQEIETNLINTDKKIEHIIQIAQTMHKQTKRLLKEITQTINKYKKYDINEIDRYISEKESKKLVDKISKLRAKYYGGEFESFYGFLISPLLSHLEYDIAYWSIQTEGSKRARIHKNWKMIVFHHEWCYRVFINIEAILNTMEAEIPNLKKTLEEV